MSDDFRTSDLVGGVFLEQLPGCLLKKKKKEERKTLISGLSSIGPPVLRFIINVGAMT